MNAIATIFCDNWSFIGHSMPIRTAELDLKEIFSFSEIVDLFCMDLPFFMMKFIWYQIKVKKFFFLEILVTYNKEKFGVHTYDEGEFMRMP